MSGNFTIRVYGLLVEDGRVLVSDEVIRGRHITKFPGGGMEFGEGPLDALVREIRAEGATLEEVFSRAIAMSDAEEGNP